MLWTLLCRLILLIDILISSVLFIYPCRKLLQDAEVIYSRNKFPVGKGPSSVAMVRQWNIKINLPFLYSIIQTSLWLYWFLKSHCQGGGAAATTCNNTDIGVYKTILDKWAMDVKTITASTHSALLECSKKHYVHSLQDQGNKHIETNGDHFVHWRDTYEKLHQNV